MLIIIIPLLIAFLFVSWLLLDRYYTTKRFLEKYEAEKKRNRNAKYTSGSKTRKRTKDVDMAIGPATALAGAATIHHLRNHNGKDVDIHNENVNAMLDEELDDMYMMDEDEAMDYYGEVHNYSDDTYVDSSYDDAAYDDYMASLDEDY